MKITDNDNDNLNLINIFTLKYDTIHETYIDMHHEDKNKDIMV